MGSCKHSTIEHIVLNCLEWDGEECLVGHLDAPEQCWICPECNAYVSYEQRQAMMGDDGSAK
jgi:hypothetical protein